MVVNQGFDFTVGESSKERRELGKVLSIAVTEYFKGTNDWAFWNFIRQRGQEMELIGLKGEAQALNSKESARLNDHEALLEALERREIKGE